MNTKQSRIYSLRELGIVNDAQIETLDAMGFFTAPASARHHGSYVGGLYDHSYSVATTLRDMTEAFGIRWSRGKSPLIVGMFHDLCKSDEYELRKSDRYDYVSEYKRRDDVVLRGHGDKSVILLSQIMTLTEEEALCIRYHMGAYETDRWEQYDMAIKKYPTVLWTHHADMVAAKVIGV